MANISKSSIPSNPSFTFETLSNSIRQLHEHFSNRAKHAINITLTLRNWFIGYYIAEYQLNGLDRANYGDKIIATLADSLKSVSNCNRKELYKYLDFYRAYPKLVPTVASKLPDLLSNGIPFEIVRTMSRQLAVGSDSSLSPNDPSHQWKVITSLSFSHLWLLSKVNAPLARTFYEIECLKGNWSVRELKRQIGSLYYERIALTAPANRQKLADRTQASAENDTLALTIRDPYIFDFLGLRTKEIRSENDLEDALLERLQDFLLELGRGFCFEARQKRILIGDEYFQVDLVFYHRILKCHLLIDLKNEPFSHENIGQLNSYVAYYAKNEMSAGDNPPIGLLLCTQKNNELVEYALAGMSQTLFVSKYQLELPDIRDLEEFIRRQRLELGQ